MTVTLTSHAHACEKLLLSQHSLQSVEWRCGVNDDTIMSNELKVTAIDVADGPDQAAVNQESPVLVTGFGPFHHHTVNASWVAVQEMARLGVEHKSKKIPLEVKEVPVAYDVVSSTIPDLHKEINPRLCVHVGVSPYTVIKLEKFGKNVGYRGADIFGKVPQTKMCVPGGPECLPTKVNVERICEAIAQTQCEVTFEISHDAGRYLCDFIYYTSLHHGTCPVVFVHVPELNSPYSAEQLGSALKQLIEVLLEDLELP